MNAKAHELYALHDVEFVLPECSIGAIGAIGEDDGRYVKAYCIDYDHCEDIVKGSLITNDEMEARVQDEGLARDHGHPS